MSKLLTREAVANGGLEVEGLLCACREGQDGDQEQGALTGRPHYFGEAQGACNFGFAGAAVGTFLSFDGILSLVLSSCACDAPPCTAAQDKQALVLSGPAAFSQTI